MRELTELEHWLLAVAAKAGTDGAALNKQGMTLPAALLHRGELQAILESANEEWGSAEDVELDEALRFLGNNGCLVNLDPMAQLPDGRQHKQIIELGRRITALEQKRGSPYQKEWDLSLPFRITGIGESELRRAEAARGEELEEA